MASPEHHPNSGRKFPVWNRRIVWAAAMLFIGAVIALVVCALRGNPEQTRMQALIARLANAEPRYYTIADMIVYQTKGDETVRSEIKALGREAVPDLIEGLRHKNDVVRRQCADLLGEMPTKEGIGALVECLRDQRMSILSLMAIQRALHKLTGFDYTMPPGEFLPDVAAMRGIWEPWWEDNKAGLVNTDAGVGLVQSDGTVAQLPLVYSKPGTSYPLMRSDIQEMESVHPAIRDAAALRLGRTGDPRAVPPLLRALKDENWQVRRSAAVALGNIGAPDAVPGLQDALKDDNLYVRSAAEEAIRKIKAR